jgi:hypothetical protein
MAARRLRSRVGQALRGPFERHVSQKEVSDEPVVPAGVMNAGMTASPRLAAAGPGRQNPCAGLQPRCAAGTGGVVEQTCSLRDRPVAALPASPALDEEALDKLWTSVVLRLTT